MTRNFATRGMAPEPEGNAELLKEILGRPMRSYRSFIRETIKKWGLI